MAFESDCYDNLPIMADFISVFLQSCCWLCHVFLHVNNVALLKHLQNTPLPSPHLNLNTGYPGSVPCWRTLRAWSDHVRGRAAGCGSLVQAVAAASLHQSRGSLRSRGRPRLHSPTPRTRAPDPGQEELQRWTVHYRGGNISLFFCFTMNMHD